MKSTKSKNLLTLMRILEFTDSTFPVGTFSFSNGLETASFENIVKDAQTLEDFVRSQARQAAFSDGVAALHAHRAYTVGDYDKIREADKYLILFKMNDEARQMLRRMGKKLAELIIKISPDDIAQKWLDDINEELTPGTYPVGQGIIFAASGANEEQLFAAHQYGIINMVLSAALRCVKVSHYDTQKILFKLSEETTELYNTVKNLELKDMNAFFPQLDILASLHEKGNMRMFMN